jgi:hypothetical protein
MSRVERHAPDERTRRSTKSEGALARFVEGREERRIHIPDGRWSKGRPQGDGHGEEALRRCGRGDEGARCPSAVGDCYRDATATGWTRT